MKIEDDKSISQLQKEFKTLFPYLKLEFYKKSHEEHMGSAKRDQFDHSLLIGDIRKTRNGGELKIIPDMSAGKLEEEFKEIFGLNVQVFRKSGTSWLQTTTTDNRSLKDLNARAKISAEGYNIH